MNNPGSVAVIIGLVLLLTGFLLTAISAGTKKWLVNNIGLSTVKIGLFKYCIGSNCENVEFGSNFFKETELRDYEDKWKATQAMIILGALSSATAVIINVVLIILFFRGSQSGSRGTLRVVGLLCGLAAGGFLFVGVLVFGAGIFADYDDTYYLFESNSFRNHTFLGSSFSMSCGALIVLFIGCAVYDIGAKKFLFPTVTGGAVIYNTAAAPAVVYQAPVTSAVVQVPATHMPQQQMQMQPMQQMIPTQQYSAPMYPAAQNYAGPSQYGAPVNAPPAYDAKM